MLDKAETSSAPNYWAAWWPVLLGLAVLYLPTYYDLANGLWNQEEQAHGPIVLAVALYLAWQGRGTLVSLPQHGASAVLGWVLLACGLLLYALGRSQSILLLEVGSQIPVILGALLILGGRAAARQMWFPLFFLLFMVPLPGMLVEALTGPLKHYVSLIAEHVLYALGYPIARSGVVITIGPYQLLVADACSGLHSIFTLTAMGLLYIYLMGHQSWLRNAILMACILPIAFLSNVVRVMALVLITYHFGDEAGQGFLHDLSGIVLFVVGLLFLFAVDSVLGWGLRGGAERRTQSATA
ncbi:MAG: exosortase B [Burkholderiales bacterium]|nr:exosortase B [Burkholderiales bacterium]